MFKKKQWFLLVFFVLFIPINAYAQVISQTGSVFLNTVSYDSANDYYKVDLDPSVLAGGSVRHRLYHDDTFTSPSHDSTHYFPASMDYAYATYTCKLWIQDIFYDANGNQVGEIKFYADQLVNSQCITTYSPPVSDTPATGTACTNCDLFNCPGWQEYMQGLQDIKNAIPPAPNWQEVSNTFRDTIAPQIKADLQEVLGRAPDPPSAPSIDPPQALNGLDDRGITDPTGENAPGLDNSTFSESDIKNNAKVIDERQDDSGGFIINNPLNGLPTQEEFIQNSPNEGTAPLPGDPTEQENISPTPSEGDNVAPSPDEGTNTAPTPTDPGGTAPIPDESGTAPLPNESGTAPLPNESGTAPLPGG